MRYSGISDRKDFNVVENIKEFVERNSDGRSGGILFFVGITREDSYSGKRVVKLEIETHRELADRELRKISKEFKDKFGLNDACIIHGEGEFSPGEVLVLVALAARGRKDLFPAMERIIEAYKSRPPIFKKEIYSDGTGEWIRG
ncbi:MAG: molybdenum cofactor biosynthesis protein MoaE [Candidatus Geothermarchaeales archaeon]